MQSESDLSILIFHFRRTPENGTSIIPSFGNVESTRPANPSSSVTTAGKISDGGCDMLYHASATLYLMLASFFGLLDMTNSVALSCWA
jgi:hypothetical protein